MKRYSTFLKFQNYSLTIKQFSVIPRKLISGGMSYPSTEAQSTYRTAPAERVTLSVLLIIASKKKKKEKKRQVEKKKKKKKIDQNIFHYIYIYIYIYGGLVGV